MNYHGFNSDGKRVVVGAAKNKDDMRRQLLGGIARDHDIHYVRYGRSGYTISDIYAGRSGVKIHGVYPI